MQCCCIVCAHYSLKAWHKVDGITKIEGLKKEEDWIEIPDRDNGRKVSIEMFIKETGEDLKQVEALIEKTVEEFI